MVWRGCLSIIRTLLGGAVQDNGRGDQLLEDLIALLAVGLCIGLFLLTKGLQKRGNLGLKAVGGLGLAQGIDVLGELVGELGERTLDEEGGGGGGHDGMG